MFARKVQMRASKYVLRTFGDVLAWASDSIASLNYRRIGSGGCQLRTKLSMV